MNDYYDYINGFNDMNYMTSPNNMIGDLNYQSLMPVPQSVNTTKSKTHSMTQSQSQSTNQNDHVLDSFEGFKKGNIFGNLYDTYKNHKPAELKASSEREDMLMQLQELNFALIDLGMYLDIYENDVKCINLFNEYQKKERNLRKMFENKYGPLTFDSGTYTNAWTWINSPWPWEVQK